MKRVLLSWSSGKDSARALHILRPDPAIELCGLPTTLNSQFDRVAMHGTHRSVLEAQAAAAAFPLWTVPLPWPPAIGACCPGLSANELLRTLV